MGALLLSFIRNSSWLLFWYISLIGLIATDMYITRDNKIRLLNTIFLCVMHLFVDYGSLWNEMNMTWSVFHGICVYTGYILRPFILYFFARLIFPDSKHRILLGASCLNLIMYATTHFTHLCVFFVNGRFHRGPLGCVIFVICGWALAYLIIESFRKYYKKHLRRWILPPVASILIIHAVYCDFLNISPYPSDLNQALVITILLLYLFYHLQLAEEYEKEKIQKQELQLMISQIQPHFFFNTITAIQTLCEIDPEQASETLGNFALYMRQNMMTQKAKTIPFEQELEHVKAYTDIEMVRFHNVEILYDLQVTDFEIAALSIQPLVENAIKYGIRAREHGVVNISTRKAPESIVVTIKDNGVGFDTKIIDTLDETHVGIYNVRSRLKMIQNANVKISSCSEGTTVTITIPCK